MSTRERVDLSKYETAQAELVIERRRRRVYAVFKAGVVKSKQAMAITALVSVEEYLHSTFEPDAEYVEGRIVPRSVPQKPHSKMQGRLYRALYEVSHPLGYEVWLEQRVRTQADPSHFRVPDLCVTHGEPAEDVFTAPPILCVEILSPDDTVVEVRAKVREYLSFGVASIWIVDPQSGSGEVHTPSGIERVEDGIFEAGAIAIHLDCF